MDTLNYQQLQLHTQTHMHTNLSPGVLKKVLKY